MKYGFGADHGILYLINELKPTNIILYLQYRNHLLTPEAGFKGPPGAKIPGKWVATGSEAAVGENRPVYGWGASLTSLNQPE